MVKSYSFYIRRSSNALSLCTSLWTGATGVFPCNVFTLNGRLCIPWPTRLLAEMLNAIVVPHLTLGNVNVFECGGNDISVYMLFSGSCGLPANCIRRSFDEPKTGFSSRLTFTYLYESKYCWTAYVCGAFVQFTVTFVQDTFTIPRIGGFGGSVNGIASARVHYRPGKNVEHDYFYRGRNDKKKKSFRVTFIFNN